MFLELLVSSVFNRQKFVINWIFPKGNEKANFFNLEKGLESLQISRYSYQECAA